MFETNDGDSFGLLEDDEFLNDILPDETRKYTFHQLGSSNNVGGTVIELENKASELENHFNVPNVSILKTSCTNNYPSISSTSCGSLQTPSDLWGPTSGRKESKRKLDATHQPSPVRPKRERKFPGPAGLLPDRKSGGITPAKLNSYLDEEQSSHNASMEDLCSQGRCSGSVLEEEPWQQLLTDLGPDRNILDEVNVASVKRKATSRCFVGRKVPFLAAVLHHLDVSSPDPCIILRDVTGEIHGTLHREVWEKFAGELVVGSVLVVKNVGLLSTGMSLRRHYLNITANNLATIYSASPDATRREWIYPFTSQDFAKTIQDWRSLVTPASGVRSPASPGLFNNSWNPLSLNNSSAGSPRCQVDSNSFGEKLRPALLNASHSQNNQPKHAPPGTMGRNLLGSFSPLSPQPNRLSYNSIPTTPKSINNVKNLDKTNSNSKTFHFNPVISNQQSFNINTSLQKISEKRDVQFTSQNRLIQTKTDCPKTINTTVLLSQSSQLTAEEQSVVDSVFDGIDADSLFDDDF